MNSYRIQFQKIFQNGVAHESRSHTIWFANFFLVWKYAEYFIHKFSKAFESRFTPFPCPEWWCYIMEVYWTIQSLATVISCKKEPPIFLHHTCDISSIQIMIITSRSWCILPRNCFRRRNEKPLESTVTTTWGWNRIAASIVSFSFNWHFQVSVLKSRLGNMHWCTKAFPHTTRYIFN